MLVLESSLGCTAQNLKDHTPDDSWNASFQRRDSALIISSQIFHDSQGSWTVQSEERHSYA